MNSFRLALVVNAFPVLSETFIFNKAVGLRSAGVDVHIIAQNQYADISLFSERMKYVPAVPVTYSLLAGGWKRFPLAFALEVSRHPRNAYKLWRKASQRFTLRKALKAFILSLPLETRNFDIIHFEYSGLAVSYLETLPMLSARLITSCRGAAEQIVPLVNPHRGAQLRQMFTFMDKVHCVSEDMIKTVQQYGVKLEKAFVNHPSIDVAQFSRSKPYPQKEQGPYRLISVGRLHWKKGLEFGLLTLRHLLDDGWDVYYDIVGGGVEEARLRYAIQDLGLSGRVCLHGRQTSESVRLIMEQADICLLPSLSEGLSNVALEAMAMEIPVVSTTAGGMEEAITDGKDGFLAPPWKPAEMVEKVQLLLRSPSLRVVIGQAGRFRVESSFNLNRQISCFLEHYIELLSKK